MLQRQGISILKAIVESQPAIRGSTQSSHLVAVRLLRPHHALLRKARHILRKRERNSNQTITIRPKETAQIGVVAAIGDPREPGAKFIYDRGADHAGVIHYKAGKGKILRAGGELTGMVVP